MFISKYEKEELQKKIENLSLLVTQTTDRAQKSEEKLLELSMQLLVVEEMQIQQKLKIIEVIEEIEDIEGLSDAVTAKITNCDSRVDGLENFFAARYRHYDDVEKDLKYLTKANKNLASNISSVENRFDDFFVEQNSNSSKVGEQIKMLSSDQKVQFQKILAVERTVAMTRGILFEVKKEATTNKKDLQDLCKIAVTRDEPVFVLEPPKVAAAKARKSRSTKGVKLGPLAKTPYAPWGLKLDGTPRKRPGKKIATKLESQECTIPI
jgi:hypothetical protein